MQHRNRIRKAHELAMRAKGLIFEAQDAIGYPEDVVGDRVRTELGELRARLEAFDRTVRAIGGIES